VQPGRARLGAAGYGGSVLLQNAELTLLGTLAPSMLFAYGQARVAAEVAGAFVNLEPLIGAATGAVVFGDPVGLALAAGATAILAGIALSSLPWCAPAGGAGAGGHPAGTCARWNVRWSSGCGPRRGQQ